MWLQERVDKTNWKYMLRNRIAGIRPFAWCFKGEPAFEEGQEEPLLRYRPLQPSFRTPFKRSGGPLLSTSHDAQNDEVVVTSEIVNVGPPPPASAS